MNLLFEKPQALEVSSDVWLLSAFIQRHESSPQALVDLIVQIAVQSPFRHMQVKGGKRMRVATTSCGDVGWISDLQGYRYSALDPLQQRAWPAMPFAFQAIAQDAAAQVGWRNFTPDSCLVNRYEAGVQMGTHRDEDERDLEQPIVSVSLGASCRFYFGGLSCSDKMQSLDLHEGDVLVWGNRARLMYHGVRSLKQGVRFNLTFRKAL